ncbi:hypothetical protein GCM10010508_46290 [Streptomyces naganishii JCM 4654]|uniref:Uncharacterized protein n=1 Tax=Streptomyces naganishii JCM 4654 TaxID=1306179 RepID=A0A918Y6M5_9ACTN|nr:hypothetical protein GCM10010508_46290 [Streptomyces naganishii JCM 4654]
MLGMPVVPGGSPAPGNRGHQHPGQCHTPENLSRATPPHDNLPVHRTAPAPRTGHCGPHTNDPRNQPAGGESGPLPGRGWG